MLVYRIAKAEFIGDISGTGAYLYGGRWNSAGVRLLYTAGSTSLALLEVLVHFNSIRPQGFSKAVIEIPDNLVLDLDRRVLPFDWKRFPPASALKEIGNQFVETEAALALNLPSAIVSDEHNFLLTPLFPDFANKVKILEISPFVFDPRLLKF